MTKRTYRAWLAVLGFALMAVFSSAANASMSGIDHLADNLSVTDFWVNGTGGFQAGQGGRSAPGPELPDQWHPGLMVHVVWDVRDWEHDTSSQHEADVPVDPYTEDGDTSGCISSLTARCASWCQTSGRTRLTTPAHMIQFLENNRGICIRHGSIGVI